MTSTINYVTEVLIQTAVATTPALDSFVFVYESVGAGTGILNMPSLNLNIGEIVSNSIGNVFNNIWDWLLINLITPFLLIGFLILFFAVQYFLIRFYYLLAKNVITKTMLAYNTIIQSNRFKTIIAKYQEILE